MPTWTKDSAGVDSLSIGDFLWKYVERYDRENLDPRIVRLTEATESLAAGLISIQKLLGETVMPTIEELKAQGASNTLILQKVSGEQRQILDKLTEAQGNIDEKIAEAVAAARAQDQAALETALTELKEEQDAQTALLGEMDARVADAPAEPPVEPETPTEPQTPPIDPTV